MNKYCLYQRTTYKFMTSAVCLFVFICTQAQPNMAAVIDSAKIPQPAFKYQPEYAFDAPLDEEAWKKEQPGLHLAFGSTDRIYYRTDVPALSKDNRNWNETGWRGERLNAIIVAWSPDTIRQLRFILQDLRSDKGNVLSRNNMKLNMIRYVISNYPYDAREVTCGVGPVDKAFLMPDRFESFDRFDLPGKTVRPVWLSVDIPPGTMPGTYKGIIEVRSDKQSMNLQVAIKVQNLVLPKPKDWSFRLDLWQNPWVIAEYYKVKPWSREHISLLKGHMKLYADAGGKFITTYAVHSPWADNSYMIEGSMIEWIKQKNSSWKFDYSIFDQYVQLAMDAGIDKAITLYTPIPWGERFRYKEESTGKYITEQWLPTSTIFRKNWNVFLSDLKSHLEKKGWFGKTYLGINENAMEQTLAAIKVMKDHSPAWKITYAGDWHPELDGLLDDYSCVYGKEPSMSEVKKRTARKQTSTYYVCCTPAKPNTFVFSPPVEGRWLGWYSFAYGYDGFLRWAYDAWPADPVRDARHLLWPAGDCYMVYPGAASSIRFEKMREGISDYEKLRILRAAVSKSTDPSTRALSDELEQQLRKIATEKEFNSLKLEEDIKKGKSLMERMSERLR